MEPEKSAKGSDEDPSAAIPSQFLVGAVCDGLGASKQASRQND